MAFELVKLDCCGSDAQRYLQPELVWVIKQLMVSTDGFDGHTHRQEGSAGRQDRGTYGRGTRQPQITELSAHRQPCGGRDA